MTPHFEIKSAKNTCEDMKLLTGFMSELAAYDNHTASIAPEKLQKQLFDYDTNVKAFLAFRKNEPIGFILCYECFTVYHGDRGLYVPGAYIIEKYRHLGYGVKLFQHISQYALENGFEFMNWIVESNNNNANTIYKKMGAQVSEGWSYVRVAKEIIEKAVKRIK